MYDTLPYSIVVPALVLGNRPGVHNLARSGFFECEPELGNMFTIEFWFKPDAYPREGATEVLAASLNTADGGGRGLILRLNDHQITLEFQAYHGPLSKPPPQGKWTHLALVYNKGKLQVIYWHEGRLFYEGSADLNDESYRLTELVLETENEAEHSFAELRLWNTVRVQKDLADFRYLPLDGNEPGLVGYWKLDEGSGTLMIDSSTGGNDGGIHGGEWQRDSGLHLQMGMVKAGEQRYRVGDGRLGLYQNRAQWINPPRLDQQIAYLDTLLAARQRVMEEERSLLQTRKSELVSLENTKLSEEDHRVQKQRELDGELQQNLDAVTTQREEVEKGKEETLARIESSRRIHLKDFILRLQEDIARGRENIRKEYGRVYGLDTVSMDVKVVPGVGGVGLHLPDPDTRIDPGRLSTLKLRFRAGPAEGEDKAKLATVPGLEGGTEDFARRKLAQAGFRVDAVYQEVVDPVQEGRILAQIYDAKEGNQAELDSVITLVVGRRQ